MIVPFVKTAPTMVHGRWLLDLWIFAFAFPCPTRPPSSATSERALLDWTVCKSNAQPTYADAASTLPLT